MESTAHGEFFQPGEIFQLDQPLVTTTAVDDLNSHQFEPSVFSNSSAKVGASSASQRHLRMTGLDNSSSSSSEDDGNEEEDDRMEFEPLMVHSDYPDIYSGVVPSSLMLFGGDYNGSGGGNHHGAKHNHRHNFHHTPHDYPQAASYALRVQQHTGGAPRIVVSDAKYPAECRQPEEEDYLGLGTTDGPSGPHQDSEATGWKYANTCSSPPPPHPPPYPHQQPPPASMTLLTSKHRDTNSEAASRAAFGNHHPGEDYRCHHPAATPQLRGMLPPTAMAGGGSAVKYEEFGDSILL